MNEKDSKNNAEIYSQYDEWDEPYTCGLRLRNKRLCVSLSENGSSIMNCALDNRLFVLRFWLWHNIHMNSFYRLCSLFWKSAFSFHVMPSFPIATRIGAH